MGGQLYDLVSAGHARFFTLEGRQRVPHRHLQYIFQRGALHDERQTWWPRQTVSSPEYAIDGRVIQTDLLVENGMPAREAKGYSADAFNNVTDASQYDFGNTSGSPGQLIRHTGTTSNTNMNYTNPSYTQGLPYLGGDREGRTADRKPR